MKTIKDPLIILPAYDFDGTMKVIIESIEKYKYQTDDLFFAYKTDETTHNNLLNYCEWLWSWCRTNIKYRPDLPLTEQIRTPSRTLADAKTGVDCEDFAILISTVLLNNNVPHCLRVTDYGSGWAHIYVVANHNTKKAIIIDPVNSRFNVEKPFMAKKDYKIKLSGKGLGRIKDDGTAKKNSERKKIAKAAGVEFDINRPAQYFVSPNQLSFDFSGKGLGKLPQSLLREREFFMLKLWKQMLISGVTATQYRKGGDYEIKIKQASIEAFAEYVQGLFPNEAILVIPAYEKQAVKDGKPVFDGGKPVMETIPARISVKFDNGQSTTFVPANIANIAFQIGGPDVFIKPTVATVDPFSLSPVNPELIKFLKTFVGNDPLRPAMTGINFDSKQNTVCATDAHRLMVVYGSGKNHVSDFGIFSVDGLATPIDERFPDYYNAIPSDPVYFVNVNAQRLLDTLKSVDKYANKVTHQISLLRSADGTLEVKAEEIDENKSTSLFLEAAFEGEFREIGFNAKFLMEGLTSIIKYAKQPKNLSVRLEMVKPSSAVNIKFDSKFGSALFLIMPVMLYREGMVTEEEPKTAKMKKVEPEAPKDPVFFTGSYVNYFGNEGKVIGIKEDSFRRQNLTILGANGITFNATGGNVRESTESLYLGTKKEFERPPIYKDGDYVENSSGKTMKVVKFDSVNTDRKQVYKLMMFDGSTLYLPENRLNRSTEAAFNREQFIEHEFITYGKMTWQEETKLTAELKRVYTFPDGTQSTLKDKIYGGYFDNKRVVQLPKHTDLKEPKPGSSKAAFTAYESKKREVIISYCLTVKGTNQKQTFEVPALVYHSFVAPSQAPAKSAKPIANTTTVFKKGGFVKVENDYGLITAVNKQSDGVYMVTYLDQRNFEKTKPESLLARSSRIDYDLAYKRALTETKTAAKSNKALALKIAIAKAKIKIALAIK